MKNIFILLFCLIGLIELKAQQVPHFTQFLLNDYAINPAVGGSKPYFEAKSNNRYQWIGITDAPRTYILSVNGPLSNRKMGVGGYLYTDITGPTRRTGFNLSYAYHLTLSESIKLSFGLAAGVLQFTVDGDKVNLRDKGDVALRGFQSVVVPDASAGLYLYGDNFFFSASSPQLLNNKLQFFDDYSNTQSKLINHYYVSGGYTFDINSEFSIQPAFMFKYVTPMPPQLNPVLRFIYDDKFWLATSFRTSFKTHDALGLLFGYTFQENIMVGYSYDLIQSNLQDYSTGTHEVMIGIKFQNRQPASAASIE